MQPFIKSVLPPTCSIRSDPKRGRGMFAEKDFAKGEVIFTEKPLCAMQHVENRAMAWTCANCFAFLGTLEAQLASLQTYCNINTDRNLQLPQSSALHKAHTAVVECVGGCGEKYCSEECRNQAYSEHHQLLCVGPITDPNHPLVLFKQYAIANNELFLLAAQILSRIIMYRKAAGGVKEGSDPTAVFHNKVWWEVVNLDCGVATDDLKKMLNDTLELLRQALLVPILAQFPGAPIEDVFTFDFWARLVGMLEINDNSIDIDSPLYTYYLAIDEFKPQSKKAAQKALNPLVERLEQLQQEEEGEDDAEMGDDAGEASNAGDDHMHHEHHEHDDHMHEDDDDEDEEEPIIPRFTGLGVFPTEAMLNHSCEPNCTIKFPTNHLAHIVATKDIKKGEEILHCYIENKQPVEDRQYDLFEYGFQCECPKCQRDLAAKK